MEEGIKDSCEKPNPQKSWTGCSKWISKYYNDYANVVFFLRAFIVSLGFANFTKISLSRISVEPFLGN